MIFSSANLIEEWSLFVDCSILFNFHMNVLTFPWEIVEILETYQLSFYWYFITSHPIRNSHKPGCRLFKIPKNCGGWDFKLTCTHSSCSFSAKTALPRSSCQLLIKARMCFSICPFFDLHLFCFLAFCFEHQSNQN